MKQFAVDISDLNCDFAHSGKDTEEMEMIIFIQHSLEV